MSAKTDGQIRSSSFATRTSVEQVEEGLVLAPKFDNDGLVPCITTDVNSGEVLMLGYMNSEALQQTISTGEAYYWSRSRQCLWHKGATSGLVQEVVEMRIDDDQDAIWLRVRILGSGSSCHVGYRSCFYRSVPLGKIDNAREIEMKFEEKEKKFDPEKVYKGQPNPTKI